MDLNQTKKLKTYFHQGYIVYMEGEKIVDMCEIEADNLEGPLEVQDLGYYTIETEDWLYSTRVISISNIEVFAPIDWLDLLPKESYGPAPILGLSFNEYILPIADYVEDLRNAYDEAGD